jgi:hypothetical protein
VTEWVVRRWARYGHERLYAETPGGTALGYLDVKTGRFHSDDLSNLPMLQKAVADHLAAGQPPPSSPPSPPSLLSPSLPPPPPTSALEQRCLDAGVDAGSAELVSIEPVRAGWRDISDTVAGAAARERALTERAAQGRVRHVLARIVGAHTDERAWRIGADGEQAVADELANLGPPWRVLHAVRVGEKGSDIDHVVIGPGGVFTVNAKNHPDKSIWAGGDTFLVNGRQVPYVRNSRHEARRAAGRLTEQAGFPVEATGVIAVMGAHKGFTVKKQPEDGAVVVVQRRHITRFLLRVPPRLTARQIDAIYEVARRSTTWT